MKDKLTVLFFVGTVFIISALGIFLPDKVFSQNENRYLKERPDIGLQSILDGDFQEGYEEYVTDQLPARDQFVFFKNLTEKLIGKRDSNGVYFAKDNYLIEKTSAESIDTDLAEKNKQYLTLFAKKYADILGEQRVKVMVVPTAADVLRDKMPKYAEEYNQGSYIDSIYAEIGQTMSVDVRSVFFEHKQEYIYYKTDHHWTSKGAYYAYTQWAGDKAFLQDRFHITKVNSAFLGSLYSKINFYLEKDSIDIYEPNDDISYRMDYNMGSSMKEGLYAYEYLDKKDKYSVFLGGNNAIVQIDRTPQMTEDKRKLLVIKDSYAHSFVPFAVNHFSRTYMIDFRYFNLDLDKYIADNEITDILILYNSINFATDKNIYKFSL